MSVASTDTGVDGGVASVEAGPGLAERSSVLGPKVILVAVDTAVIAIGLAVTLAFEHSYDAPLDPGASRDDLIGVAVLSLPLWLAIFSRQRLYNTRFIGRRIDEFRRIVNATALGALATALVGYAVGRPPPRSSIIALFLTTLVLMGIEREAARQVFTAMRTSGRLIRQVIIAGANPEGRDLAAMLQAEPWHGYRVIGFVDDTVTDPQPVAGIPLLGTIDAAVEIARRHIGASVIVAASAIESHTTNRLARDLLDRGVHVELSSTLRDIASQRLTVRPLGRFPVVYVEPIQREGWRRAAKRTFDMVGALAGLIVAGPLLVIAAVAIKIDSRGPVLFRQTRVGRDSRPFEVLKLRSMVADAEARLVELLQDNEADGPLFKMQSDPRVTRVGRLLRTTSVDEIPQLWNVLKGEMSLVGPRPALPHETEAWDPLLTQRLRVKPGITGMWQVHDRSGTSFDDYTRLDLYYVDNWSLTTDLAILAKTVPVVALRKGAA